MKTYVSLDKRSKKAKKEYYSSMRRTWDGLNPATKVMANGKGYNRIKDKQERKRIGREFSDGLDADFFVLYEKSLYFIQKSTFVTMSIMIYSE